MASPWGCEQIRNGDPERGGEYLERTQGHVSLTTLHRADIRPMKPANSGKLFLRSPFGMSEGSDVRRQDASEMLAGFAELSVYHGTKQRRVSKDRLSLNP